MHIDPILGLVFHLFSTPRPHLDLLVAGGIFVGTVLYMTRIAGISVSYGLGDKDAKGEVEGHEVATTEKPYEGPFLAG